MGLPINTGLFLTDLLIAQDTVTFCRGESEKFQAELVVVRKCYKVEDIQTSCIYITILFSCQPDLMFMYITL